MLNIKPNHIKRVVFTSKLFPKLKSPLRIDDNSIPINGFCGGKSKNRDLLTFFGGISDVIGASTFAQLPLFRRSLRKLTNLVENELVAIGSQEILLPTIVPQRLWHKSERLKRHPNSLDNVFKFVDDDDRQLMLGPTFEESITHLVAHIDGSISESELPILLHQSSPKFRMESNPKFGIIRSNEFFMNDLYSFDADLARAQSTYDLVSHAYERIFKKLGFECIRTANEPGNIGGKYSHEYQLPIQSGQDVIIKCANCDHSLNKESVADNLEGSCSKCGSHDITQLYTIELGHTFLLSDLYSKPLNAKFKSSDGRSKHYEMGCYGLGLTRIIGAGVDLQSITPEQSTESNSNDSSDIIQIRWPRNIEPFMLGVVGPAKRSRQNQAGSTEFIEQLLNNILDNNDSLDVLVEDRDGEGIGKRLIRLQALGLPYIIVIGERFFNDPPEIELLKLDNDRKAYTRHWFNEGQLNEFLDRSCN